MVANLEEYLSLFDILKLVLSSKNIQFKIIQISITFPRNISKIQNYLLDITKSFPEEHIYVDLFVELKTSSVVICNNYESN